MYVLKHTVKALASMKQEGQVLKKSVESLKEELRKIKCDNMNILQRIKNIEDDFEDGSDEKSRIRETLNLSTDADHNPDNFFWEGW